MSNTHAICQLAVCPLRANASDEAEMVSQLLFGDYVTILTDGKPWIKVINHSDGYEGWMDFKQVKFIDEKAFHNGVNTAHPIVGNPQLTLIGPFGNMIVFLGSTLPYFDGSTCKIGADDYVVAESLKLVNAQDLPFLCQSYLNAPYLWGGKSLFGIDCSGLTQNIFKSIGIQVPRDASQQVDFGEAVNWTDRKPYDVVFFTTSSTKITHVGILVNQNEIIHAHGRVRIDSCDDTGIYNDEQDQYTHKFHSLKRWL